MDLLEVVLKKPGMQVPLGHSHPPRKPQSDKFCKFHNDYSHVTNECKNLKITIEKLIQEGELLEYGQRESGPNKRRREADDKTSDAKDDTWPRGVIQMIYGGCPPTRDSSRNRKASAGEMHAHERHEILKMEGGLPPP